MIDTLINDGCELREQTPFVVTVQCGESLIMKRADDSWNVLLRDHELDKDKASLVEKIPFKPSSVEIGRINKSGSWSRIDKYVIDDEVALNFTLKNMKNTKSEKLHNLRTEARRIKRLSDNANQNFKMIDKKRILKTSIDAIAHDTVFSLENTIGRRYKTSVICDARPEITNQWVPNKKDEIDMEMRVHCYVPHVGDRAKKQVEKLGEWKTTSILDLQAFKSIVTPENDMFVNGVYLKHPHYGGPFVSLRVRDPKTIREDGFVKRMKLMEDTLNS